MSVVNVDVDAEVKRLREIAKGRRRPGKRSRLLRFRGDLLALYAAGATIADLQRWLRERQVSVAHSTVARWMRRYGEFF